MFYLKKILKLSLFFTLIAFSFTACDIEEENPKTTSTTSVSPTPEISKATNPSVERTLIATLLPTPKPVSTPEPTIITTPASTATPTPKPLDDLDLDLKKVKYNNEVSYANGKYIISNNFEIMINDNTGFAFNKFHITYSSSEYIKGYVTYKLNGNTHQEEFFLEPGNNITFSSLTDKFFNKQTGNSISKINLFVLNASQSEFELEGIKLQKIDVPNTTIFLQNGYHKIGIDLLWGGGLNYIENLNKKDNTLRNLEGLFNNPIMEHLKNLTLRENLWVTYGHIILYRVVINVIIPVK